MGFLLTLAVVYLAIGCGYQTGKGDFDIDFETAKKIVVWPKNVFGSDSDKDKEV